MGLAATSALTRLMTKMIFGVSTADPLTFASVALTLTLVALAARYIPAQRVMRVDPIVVLHFE